MDKPVVGDTIRSLDFAWPIRVEDTYVEGEVLAIRKAGEMVPQLGRALHDGYEIRCTRRVVNGVECDGDVGMRVLAPANGLAIWGGDRLTDGVTVIARTMTPAEASKVTITVLSPTVLPPVDEDPLWIWKESDESYIVASGGDRCPVWGDVLPYKSVTAIVPAALEDDAIYSLEYCHGGGSIEMRTTLPDGRRALRSNYMCW